MQQSAYGSIFVIIRKPMSQRFFKFKGFYSPFVHKPDSSNTLDFLCRASQVKYSINPEREREGGNNKKYKKF